MAKETREQREPKAKYEDMVDIYRGNLDFEAFYFAALMKSGEHGKEGTENGLFAAIAGLRDKVGLEGILGNLEAQGMQSINDGNGLNAQFNLATVIDSTAKTYIQSAFKLKVEDLVPYIADRTGVEIVQKYKGKTIEELRSKESSKEEKQYAEYLLSQMRNGVMAKMIPLAYLTRAQRETEAYKASQEEH